MSKMPDNIKTWVEALESGKYQQTESTLKRTLEDGSLGFCCLGVYMDVHGKKVRAEKFDSDHEGSEKHYNYLRKVIKKEVVEDGVSMNDQGYSFQDIAQMIREYYGK